MKPKSLFIAILTLVITSLHAQRRGFEKGYYINSGNNKIECLIKNEDWSFNPTQFECIVGNETEPRIVKMNEISEIAIGDEYKFKKVTVELDKSSDGGAIVVGKALNLTQEQLLLSVLIEGKASLYSYKSLTFTRFFYSVNQSEIKQLSYKVYYDEDEKINRKNEVYKQEILNNLKCDKITQNDIDRLEYSIGSLKEIFVRYNVCVGSEVVDIKEKKNIETFEMYVKAGVGISSFSFDNGNKVDFDDKTRVKIAIEAEINLSNKQKKWSLLIEPSYQIYSNTYTYPLNNTSRVEVEYNAIDFSLGLRHYFDLGAKSLLYANAYFTFSVATASKVDFTASTYDYKISGASNPAVGLGYLYNKRYSVELRYDFKRTFFERIGVDSSFSTIGLAVGYKFL